MPSEPTETIQFPRRGGGFGYMSRCDDVCVIWLISGDGPTIVTVVPIGDQYRSCREYACENAKGKGKLEIVFRKSAWNPNTGEKI